MSAIWGSSIAPQPVGGASPFFNGTNYGAAQSYGTSPISNQIREQNLSLPFAEYLNGLGVADNDSAFNRWAYQQYPRFQRGYGMATLQNPFLTIQEYMPTLGGMDALQAQFNQASPSARGLNWAKYAAPARWINR